MNTKSITHHWLRAIGQTLLIVAVLAGCVPVAPPAPVVAPAAQPNDPGAQAVSPFVRVADQPRLAPASTRAGSLQTALPEPELALPDELIGKAEITAKRTENSATFDLGGGEYALVQDAQPMHYQDKSGQWRRINPAFAAVENGWMNNTNSLSTGVALRNSRANVTLTQSGVGWEPRSLQVVDDAGQATVLATMLGDARAVTGTVSADQRTLTYPASWSDTSIQDMWQSDYGRVEYRLRMDKRPPASLPVLGGTEGGQLELRVSLRLLPGTQIHVEGKPVKPADLPLETRQPLAFVSEGGETLWLQPPRAYEERNPTARAQGSYRLSAGANASTVELAVRMPYNWLAASDRQYPVVIDPLFQIMSPTTVAVADYNVDTHAFSGYLSTDPIGLGQFPDGLTEALVRFALPTMPPSATVTLATLEVRPRGGTIPCDHLPGSGTCYQSSTKPYLTSDLEVVPLLNLNWISGSAPSYNPAQALPAQTVSWSNTGITAGEWDMTDLVNSWKSSPLSNYGVVIKLKDEFCFQDVEKKIGGGWGGGVPLTVRHYPEGCGFFDIDYPSVYGGSTDVSGGVITGGIRLLVRYNAHVLNVGHIVTVPTDDPWNPGGLPTGGAPYWNTEHEYRLQSLSAEWRMASVRGLGTPVGDPTVPNQHDTYLTPLRGTLSTELWDQDDIKLYSDMPEAVTLGLYALDGRANVGAVPRLRLGKSADATQPVKYDVWYSSEKGTLAPTLGHSQVMTYTFTSRRPAAIWNVELPGGSVSSVDVQIVSANVNFPNSPDYYGTYADKFSAALLKSGSGEMALLPELHGTSLTSVYAGGTYRLNTDVEPAAGDVYGLVVAYDGPGITMNECAEWQHFEGGDICTSWDVLELEFTVRLRATSCAPGDIALSDGTCQPVNCPTNALDYNAVYKEEGGLGLWSAAGWTAGTSNSGAEGEAVFIGPPRVGGVHQPPTIAVGGSSISYVGSLTVTSVLAKVLLVNCASLTSPNDPVTPGNSTKVYNGSMKSSLIADEGNAVGLIPSSSSSIEGSPLYTVWPNKELGRLSSSQFYILPNGGSNRSLAKASAHYAPDLQGDSTTIAYAAPVKVTWSYNYQGWPSLAAGVAPDGTRTAPTIAGLTLDVGTVYSMDIEREAGTPTFVGLRATAATISQPANMGGASKPVVAIIHPQGKGAAYCRSDRNCIDLRGPGEVYGGPQKPTWQMPDIHINSAAGTVMVNSPGSLRVWSADHPAQANSPQAVTQNFSFDTFGATVSVVKEKCGGANDVMVIRGTTRLALPMIGDGANPDSFVSAGFKLCQDPTMELREVEFEFYSPVGVPVGSSGLFVNGLQGKVEFGPDHTTVTFGMDFYYSDRDTLVGHGDVTIDTRGLFDLQANAKILGIVDADGRLWVAWNPLDTGFEMHLAYDLGDIARLDGTVRAHAWQGRGWQGRYSWLPDNGESHFAAQIAATFTLKEGAAIDMWPLVIPPTDIDRGLELAFGQFCTNSDCSSYEWGIKAQMSVCGYAVGVYYGFDHGVDLILGNDGHVLIDQYGSLTAQAVALEMQNTPAENRRAQVMAAPAAVAGVVTQVIPISYDTENFLVGMGWQAGSPQLKLYNPSGEEVISNTAQSVFISTTTRYIASMGTTTSTLVGVQLNYPRPGNWKAVISNVQGPEHFKFAFLANKGAQGTPPRPDQPNNQGWFTAPPANDTVQVSGYYTISWTLPPGVPPSATISLDYSVSNLYQSSYMTRTWYTPIVRGLPVQSGVGTYRWDTSGLRAQDDSGATLHYRVRAVVDDGFNTFPSSAEYDPCQPGSGLPLERAFDARRFPGTAVFTSTGSVSAADYVGPGTPANLALSGMDGAIQASWDRRLDKDLAAYQVDWGLIDISSGSPVWVGGAPTHSARVAPTISPTLRIGGLDNTLPYWYLYYGVRVKAVDVNDLPSAYTAIKYTRPQTFGDAQIPATPVTPTLVSKSSTSATLVSSAARSSGTPAYFRITYREAITFSEVMQKDHIPLGNTTPATVTMIATLTGLRTGATYLAWVDAANGEDWHSGLSGPVRFVATNGVDSNADGVPDDWAAAHNVLIRDLGYGTYIDTDQDGLLNIQEYVAGTDPNRQDSDGDGFSDKEEVDAGTNPLLPGSMPAEMTQPRLELNTNRLDFYAKEGQTVPAGQKAYYYNAGGGALTVSPSSSYPWISAWVEAVEPGKPYIRVTVNPANLPPGNHYGVVRVTQSDGLPLIGGDQCMRVNLHLLPADANTLLRKLYLPIVIRR